MDEPSETLSRPAAVAIAVVIGLGIVVLAHSAWELLSRPIAPQWLVLAALTVSTGLVMLRILTVNVVISFSISDTFNIAAAVLFGPSAGAITAALDGLVLSSQFAFTRRTAHRVLFNIAVSAIAIWAAARVFFALAGNRPLEDGPWGAVRLIGLLAVFAAVNYLLNTGLVAMAVSLERRLPPVTVWREHFLNLWATHFGGVLAVVPVLMLQRWRPSIGAVELLVLIVPLPAILYTTFRHAVGRVQDHVVHLGQLNRVYVAVIEALAQAVDAKDQVTHDHIRRVQTQSVRLARALGVSGDDELQAIMAASLLHDVGKLSVPEHILNKPGRLTPSEMDVMKRHAPAGADILSVVGFPYPVAPIVRHHHENWDGTGYPDGIAGEAIPIGARVLAVVDCFDALTSHRPYRPRLDDRAALEIIIQRRGTMYDPRVVDTFLELHHCGPAAADAGQVAPAASAPDAPAAPEADLDRELADLRVVCDLARACAASASAVHVVETLWFHLRPHLPPSTFVFYAHDDARNTLEAAYGSGPAARELSAAAIPIGDRLSGWVAATRQPIVNSDARLDLDESKREDSDLRSALAVPLEIGSRIAGVLTFYAPDENAFDESHRRLAQAAAYAAVQSGIPFAFPLTISNPLRRLETVQ